MTDDYIMGKRETCSHCNNEFKDDAEILIYEAGDGWGSFEMKFCCENCAIQWFIKYKCKREVYQLQKIYLPGSDIYEKAKCKLADDIYGVYKVR